MTRLIPKEDVIRKTVMILHFVRRTQHGLGGGGGWLAERSGNTKIRPHRLFFPFLHLREKKSAPFRCRDLLVLEFSFVTCAHLSQYHSLQTRCQSDTG